MNTYELYGQQLRNRDTLLLERRQREQADQDAMMVQDKQRMISRLSSDLQRSQQNQRQLVGILKQSPIVIQNRLRNGTRDVYRELVDRYDFHKKELDCFNSFLLKLGSPRFSSLALAMTFAVGIFWVWATMGLDAVNGNAMLTIGIATVALVAIDMIGFFAIAGVLNSCQGFFGNQKKFRTFLEIIVLAGSSLALLSFMANLLTRLMETGV